MFQSLGVAPFLVSTLASLGIKTPSEIQVQVIPRILAGRDIIGQAKTGSGKTAAFALPILQTLAKDPYGIYAVVLTPTRELAFQLADQFRVLGSSLNLRDAVVIGGLDMMPQASALAERPHVVIATPGRLADLMRSNCEMHLTHCRYLVLDEVDRLMEPKFRPDMETIIDALPPPSKRQTLLFSATMTKEEVLAQQNQFGLTEEKTDFCQVKSDEDALVAQLDQQYLFMPQNIKEVYLVYMLSKSIYAGNSCIVFVSTCRGCEVLSQLLLEMGIQCESLHSRKNQNRRLASLGKFRSGLAKVLVATDVASRGLDIPTVQLVLNYDLPRMSADYIHRVGRTARAGRGGAALTFVSQYDIEVFKSIEETVGREMKLHELNEPDVLELLKSVNAAKRMAKIRLEDFQVTKKVVKRRKEKRSEGEEDGGDDADGGDDGDNAELEDRLSAPEPPKVPTPKKRSAPTTPAKTETPATQPNKKQKIDSTTTATATASAPAAAKRPFKSKLPRPAAK